jgi:DNA polymerase (family 10)
VENSEVAAAFDELADLLELRGEDAFKVRVHRAFAISARDLDEPLEAVVVRGGLHAMEGVGKAIAGGVRELLEQGTLAALERERARVPGTLRDLLRVSGLGLKSARALWESCDVGSLGALLDACERGDVAKLPRFGEKKQEQAAKGARRLLGRPHARVLVEATKLGRAIARELEVDATGMRSSARAVVVGEARRGNELVRDLVVLATGVSAAEARKRFAAELSSDVAGPGVLSLEFGRGERARVRLVPPEHWVQSLLVETGPRAHVRMLEERAGGVEAFAELCAGAQSEEDVYARLGMPPVPPELRDRPPSPTPAAASSAHRLIEFADVRGVFHVHTTWSDGKSSLEDMIAAAKSAGFRFIGISEHSKAASYAGGLDRDRLLEQARAIERLRGQTDDIEVLHGVEVDILADGSLDLDDEVLGALDFVIASVHSDYDMTKDEMTARIVRAVSHPLVTILGHPTGRLLLAKPPFEFDLEAVASAAAANDTYLEINANAQRLDLAPDLILRARAAGASFAINPDAHEPDGFTHVEFGVTTARRAGVSSNEVLNACDAAAIRERLLRRKERALSRA